MILPSANSFLLIYSNSFDEVYEETREYFRKTGPEEIEKAEANS
ncbi:hypothetical protein [Candidatus Scalindua japonica]|nr:hypothetical protein [Candidatus Scalindua japonica]